MSQQNYIISIPNMKEESLIFNEFFSSEKKIIISNIKFPDIFGFKSILRLHKQWYFSRLYHKEFIFCTNIVNYSCSCFISDNTKHKIPCNLILYLIKKRY